MAFGTCSICREAQAKYKCPKCSVEYCSLGCFKNPLHSHTEIGVPDTEVNSEKIASSSHENDEAPKKEDVFAQIANDPVIKSLLKYKSLQVHLGVLIKLASDSQFTNEPLAENRREIANMRLCELRMGGSEENELVEEFVERVLSLMEKNGS
ncbi:hypothetical protein CLUG_00354 [Clavispora lusitaniae ATCC 42720]|uniref:HIT-type domain-containing protein n=1 Tax=Clavispora lusitaniae (strain ATCC 42720) TaxID=306902 RepID=C4XWN1_CLAL4|nr:uncharacterized protein CLUG_00354 [Clavispora lusitaniae ATCC 42720]EEQ36231.1 hypothetical protein CLUG_00354 [Clavispora lusitaniae ATCC 42720]